MKKPIGIFDSGFGGLTVFSEIRKILANENLIYYGDTAHFPYGSKSKEVVTKYSFQIAEFLMRQKVKMIVVACNTASAFTLPALKKKFKVPILGVIIPGAKAAIDATRKNRVGVIGTEGTIKSSSYNKAILDINGKAMVFSKACPLFAPLIEEGWTKHPITEAVAKVYLASLAKKEIDTLILGCTHYPLIKETIRKVVDRNIRLIDSAQETAKSVLATLEKLGLLECSKSKGRYTYYVSDSTEKFKLYGKRFLGHPLKNVKKVMLD